MVRAKFTVTEIRETVEGIEITLKPVLRGSKENEKFFALTPYGSITMGTINKDAAAQFTTGKEMYVDFTPAD